MFAVSDGTVTLRAPGECGECGECGYCLAEAAADRSKEEDGDGESTPVPAGDEQPGAVVATLQMASRCPQCAEQNVRVRAVEARKDGAVVRTFCEVRATSDDRSRSRLRMRPKQDCDKTWISSFLSWADTKRLASTGVGDAADYARRALAIKRGERPSRRTPHASALLLPPAPPPLAVPDAEADACELPTLAPGLWVGGASAAADLDWLRARGITHVLNVALEVPDYHPTELVYHSMRFRDASDDMMPMMDALPAAHAFIDDALAHGGAVLVHCRMGMSRSAAVAVSYGMQRGVPLKDALAAVVEGRRGISINFAFKAMLELLQQRRDGTDGMRNTRSFRAAT